MSLQIGSVSELNLDSARVPGFYAANWQRKIALSNEEFYRWQFMSLPRAPGIDSCVVAYDPERDAIAGVMGLNPRPFHLGGKVVNGAELTTWVVAEAYRSTGAGAKILGHIQSSYDALIGMGISAMALPVYMRSGFRYLAAIPRFVRVYDFDAVSAVAVVDSVAKKLARQWQDNTLPVPYSVREGIGDDVDALFGRLASRYNLYARDAGHLRWRYEQHPIFRYRVFVVRPDAGAGAALVVLRQETAVSGLNLFHVTDCIGDEDAMPAAFAFIDDFCRQEGAHVADFYCTAARVSKYPLSSGWFSTVDDGCFKFPHLFHPVEVRTPATTSLIYWAREDFTEMCDFSRLYVTKQDADFDRPVLKGE
ncbi:MAG: hypothetical protein ACM31P_04520 [Actinomycetota bacterium]